MTTVSSYPARPGQDYPASEAVISDDGRYRYLLNRRWGTWGPVMTWIGLNPSTAGHHVDDPTIRRMCTFARREGCRGICVLNLYALRSPDPAALRAAIAAGTDPAGPDNDQWLAGLPGCTDGPVVAAWGAHPLAACRVRDLFLLWKLTYGRQPELMCLGTTRSGAPVHPLARGRHRVPDGAPLIPYPVTS
jgi:hypothetical protein